MIQAVHVTKKYPSSVNVVDDVSFTVREGRIFGLLGPNGAGKTTLMQMISTLLLPTSGDILIYGMNTKDQAREIRRKIGFLTSEVKLDPYSTPDKLFCFFGELYQLDRDAVELKKEESFRRFDIGPFARKKIIELSTGMRQKISIAISLIHNPPVVIFDEPTNGLDILTAHQVTDYLRELRNDGHIVILSTHIFSVAQDLCDELAVMVDGRIAAQGSVTSLLEVTGAATFEEAFFRLYTQNHMD
ncbi:MAG: ABC transporter ATP-binding protein [Eubacteriales bacterium]